MLNREHLNFHRRNGRICPDFVDPENPEYISLSAAVLQLFADGCQKRASRGEIAEQFTPLRSGKHVKLADGLFKLMQSWATFRGGDELDYPAARAALFDYAATLQGDVNLQEKVLQQHPWAATDLYGDLPEHEQLMKYRELYPRELLERYNVAQVQTLLLYAERLQIKLHDPESAKLRKLFKYMKFFRLLADIRREKSGVLFLQISGPFSLLANTRKYGLQLASFFPAVCDMSMWKLTAELQLRNNGPLEKLHLDEKSQLKCPYKHFSSYVPEEIAMFHRLFREKVTDFEIVGETPFLPLRNGELIFPDLSFRHCASGKVLHLELFHRWHSGVLTQRLEQKEELDHSLVLGVDRAIATGREGKDVLLFRDFPGVENVRKLLLKKLQQLEIQG